MGLTVDYCRISLDKSGAAQGVESQHAENEDFAEEIGGEIARTYSDNDRSAKAREDGSFASRPDYERLIEDIRAGVIAIIIVWHANRLHRNVEEANRFIKIALAHGVRLFSVKRGGEYRLTRAAGRADLLRDTVAAQEESEHRGERVALARKRQARQGVYGGGVRPFGWGVDTGRTRRVCLNPKADPMERRYEDRPVLDMTRHNEAEAAEIRRWASDLLSGVSMAQVLRELAARDVKTAAETDGRTLQRNGQVVNHEGWNSKTIRQILTHPRTSGHAIYRGEIVNRNAFPAILPEETRQALITFFADPTRKKSPGNTPKWLGSLIYRCGMCDDGPTMTVRRANGGDIVYRCRERGHCQRKQADVDGFVTSVIVARLSRDDVAELLPSRVTVDVSALRDRLRELDAEEVDVALRARRKAITAVMMEVYAADIERERAEIRKQINDATAESPLADFVGTDDAAGTWERLSLGRKREILRLLATVTLLPTGRGTRTFRPESIRWKWTV